MIPHFDNSVLASYLFFSENKLLTNAEAYNNYSSKLYYRPDPRLSGYVTYSSPFKQWVYDSSVTGAHIATGISGSISLSNNQSGMKIDFENGRVILPDSFGTGLNISGSYSFKDFNFYQASDTDEALLTQNKYVINSRFASQYPNKGIDPYSPVTPAIFVSIANGNNEPFALGGTKETTTSLTMIVLSETLWQLDAVLGTYKDCKEKYFPQLSVYDDPLDAFGNIKTGIYPSGYNYKEIIANKGQPGNLFFIENIHTSKVSDNIKLNPQLYAGIVDLDITKVRTI